MSLPRLFYLILLNVVTLPGGGQWALKRKKRAAIFMIPTLIVAFVFIGHLMALISAQLKGLKGLTTARKFLSVDKISDGLWQNHTTTLKIYVFLLIICYIVSIADVIWLYLNEKA